MNEWPLIHKGSVKNIRKFNDKNILFEFSDRFSVFDWGAMPDELDGKGKALTFMADFFFKYLEKPTNWSTWDMSSAAKNLFENSSILAKLKKDGVFHHCHGIQSNYDSMLRVDTFNVVRPELSNSSTQLSYDYSKFKTKLTRTLVPLEIIFRFEIPKGASVLSRSSNLEYCKSIGANDGIKIGDKFEVPLIEFSSKLESTDRYLDYNEARDIAGLSDTEFEKLTEYIQLMAMRLKTMFNDIEINLMDGKFEVGFSEKLNELGDRDFVLLDSIGPDELRLSFKGQQLSKENLRKFYRNTSWYQFVVKAKELAQARGLENWQDICTAEFGSVPPPLPKEFKSTYAMLYLTLAEKLSLEFDKKSVFKNVWNLEELVNNLKEKDL